MRILHVIPYFKPAYAFGGPVEVAYLESKELSRMNQDVTVYTSDANDWQSRMRIDQPYFLDGIKVNYFRNLTFLTVKRTKFFLTPHIIRSAKDELASFDVIHLHEYRSFQNIVIHHYARKYHVPYILQAHGSVPKSSKTVLKSIYDILFGRTLLRDASKVIALSQQEVTQYVRMNVPREKIEVIPNAINTSDYSDSLSASAFRKKFGLTEKEKLVLYVGRIHESKGLAQLARAFSIVASKMDNVKLIIVGPDDGYLKKLKDLLAQLHLCDKVIFAGYLSKDCKMAAFRESDIFITPHFSGFPVTFLEACLARIPLITTSFELQWINDEVGFVVEDSPEEIAEAALRILRDEILRERFRKNCERMIKNFEISTVTKKLLSVYEEAAYKRFSKLEKPYI